MEEYGTLMAGIARPETKKKKPSILGGKANVFISKDKKQTNAGSARWNGYKQVGVFI